MGNKNRPLIGTADLDLFVKIAKHGFIDMEYAYRYTYPGRKKRTIEERILQLERHGFLLVTKTFIPPGYTVNYKAGYKIIALGQKALETLYEHDYHAANHAISIHSSSPYRMYHQAQVAMTCETLFQGYHHSAESKWELISIMNEKEVYLENALNQPDAGLVFRKKDTEFLILILLEIERSYASVASVNRKIQGYSESIKKKVYIEGMKLNFIEQRILFVAQTILQKESLLLKLNNLVFDDLHILVSSYQDIVSNTLDSIYSVPNYHQKLKLMGKYPDCKVKNTK